MKLFNYLIVLLVAGLTGCMTLSGNYELSAKDRSGKPLIEGMRIAAEGSGIYTARNGICSAFPGAIVTITNLTTGKELTSESPYRCR